MHPQAHDTGRKLHFDSRHQQPVFRHPYEKYNSRISNDSVYRIGDGARDFSAKRNSSKVRKKKDVHLGFQDKNIYICQAFLKENPFFGSYYPSVGPRSLNGEGTSPRGSERSISFETDFDDSRTYRVFHSGESNCNEDQRSHTKCKFKKPDDVHHFHEHHHFFHDRKKETLGSNQRGKLKESTANTLNDSSFSFIKQPIQASRMFYQKDNRTDGKQGTNGISQSSSKTGRKSSDNETYTVVCEYCQKLLRDYPNARVVGHENVPVRLSSEVGDRRPYVRYSRNGESMQKMNWMPANTFDVESIQGLTSRPRKKDRASKILNRNDESDKSSRSCSPSTRNAPRRKLYRCMKERESSCRVRNQNDPNHKLVLFRCENCKSIIQFPYVLKVLKSSSSISSCSSEEVLQRVTMRRSAENGMAVTKSSGITAKLVNKSSVSPDKKSLIQKESISSILSNTKKSFSPKASVTMEKVKSSSYKASRTSTASGMRGGSTGDAKRAASIPEKKSLWGSNEAILEEEIRSSSFNESALMYKKPSIVRRSRPSSEMNKRLLTTERSLEASLRSRESPTYEEAIISKKKSYKVPKEVRDMNKKSSCCGESKIHPYRKDDDEESHLSAKVRKRTSRCKDSAKPANKERSISRKEFGVGSERAVGTEVYAAKVEGKQKVILLRERSMQTISGKIIAADETKASKRSSTASKTVRRHGAAERMRSGTAPNSLDNGRSIRAHKENSAPGGSSKLSKGTEATKEVPIIAIDPTPKANPCLSGIQTEISDLKTQLYRLEAMHNVKFDSTETEAHESMDYPKHPIVVCTSTTYIMTNYGVEHEEKSPKGSANPKETIQIPGKKKDSAAEFGLHVESTPPRPRHEYVGQARVVNPQDKRIRKEKHCDCLGKATAPEPQAFGERIARAVHRVTHCSNRDLLSRYDDGTKSYGRSDEYRRLFGNGKNQKRIWGGNGASTDNCCMKFGGNMETHCRWQTVNFDREVLAKTIASIQMSLSNEYDSNEGLFASRSCSAAIGRQELPFSGEKTDSDITKETSEKGITLGNVRIDGRHGNGYFLRTSVSDICEYRNGSLIRLTGKSGWVVLTKKLFVQKMDKSNARDDFVVYPTIIPRGVDFRSAVTIKDEEDNPVKPERSEDMFADYVFRRGSPRQALSDSSILLPFTPRDNNARRTSISEEHKVSGTSVSRNVRHRNRGMTGIRQCANQPKFSEELYIMNSKSNRGVGSEGDAQWSCRQDVIERRRNQGEDDNTWKIMNEALPVLFEEMKTAREKRSSEVSVKCVYAETLRKKCKVFWTPDWWDSNNNNKYVFSVSGINNREHLSMNDESTKREWNRYTTKTKIISRGRSRSPEVTPQGDSPANQRNRCACCNCSPDHVCSGPNDKREEMSGFRRLLNDIGLTGINLNFLRKLPGDRVRRRGKDVCNCAKGMEEQPPSTMPTSENEVWEDQTEEEKESGILPPSRRVSIESNIDIKNIRESVKVENITEEIVQEEDIVTEKKSGRNLVEHSCGSLPSKIEILCERKFCTCQQCSNVHYIDKLYLPTSWIKKCKDERVACKHKTKKEEVQIGNAESEDEEKLVHKSDLDKWDGNGSDEECDENGKISCECMSKGDKTKGKQCCNCDSKLKLIEDRLEALEMRKKKLESSSEKEGPSTSHEKETTDLSSSENLESETDKEIKTKIVTCNNLQFFLGGDPDVPPKCQCTEDSDCPFKSMENQKAPETNDETKDVYFVTNIELLRKWSGLYAPNYKYCRSSRDDNVSAIKPVKGHRDWRHVKSTVASFLRSKIPKRNIFSRRKKEFDGDSSAESDIASSASSTSVDSFLNDCSRSSMPLRKRSFHVLSDGPHPMKPERENGKASTKRRKRKEGRTEE